MSKQSRRKRKVLQKHKPPHRPVKGPRSAVPSAQTLLRFMQLNFQAREALAKTAASLQPALWKRDRGSVERIENAQCIEEVLDLVPTATGLAEHAWLKRMRDFGPGATTVIAERLKNLPSPPYPKDRTVIEEKYIEALRWCEDTGIEALLECWDYFDDYGRSLSCVVLGLLQAQHAADRIWAFYQKVKNDRHENLFVGVLWGLIDLQDKRAAEALLELLTEGRDFYELFGFLSRAGDRRAVLPLLLLSVGAEEATREEAMWALTSIAHRIGRTAFLEELENVSVPESQAGKAREAIADRIYSYSADEAEEYFALFYERDGLNIPNLLYQQGTLH